MRSEILRGELDVWAARWREVVATAGIDGEEGESVAAVIRRRLEVATVRREADATQERLDDWSKSARAERVDIAYERCQHCDGSGTVRREAGP